LKTKHQITADPNVEKMNGQQKESNIPTHTNKSVAVFSLNPTTHACPIIRIISPLTENNWAIYWCAEYINSAWFFNIEHAKTADLIIIQRHFPAPFTAEAIKKLLKLNIPIIYETDDLFVDIPRNHTSHKNLKKCRPYIKWVIKSADQIVTSTDILKTSLCKHTTKPIHVLKNTIDFKLFLSPPKMKSDYFNILIAGTSTHQSDWDIIKAPLLEILKKHQGKVRAIFFGHLPPAFENNPAVDLIDFQGDYKQYANTLKSLSIQAALVPLDKTAFNDCKSNIKWLEYSAAGIPGIYSNSTPYNSCIVNGKTGLLAENTKTAWLQAIESLINNPEYAIELAAHSQAIVRNGYTIDNLPENYFSLFDKLIGKGHKPKAISELSITPTLIKEKMLSKFSIFLNKHFLWRLNSRRKL